MNVYLLFYFIRVILHSTQKTNLNIEISLNNKTIFKWHDSYLKINCNPLICTIEKSVQAVKTFFSACLFFFITPENVEII